MRNGSACRVLPIRSCWSGSSAVTPFDTRFSADVQGLAARRIGECRYDTNRGSIGSQMLVLRVSGIRNRASTKQTAGTTIG